MAPPRDLFAWTDRLTGIQPARFQLSLDEIESWDIESLSSRLSRPRTIDDVVRATLLAEDVKNLVERGAPLSKLKSKLRDQAQFESVWAEIRCASVIARTHDTSCTVELESANASGTNADLRVVFADGPPHMSVEIKALGLSNEEVDFCSHMGKFLDGLVPPHGFVSIHAPIDARKVALTPEQMAFCRVDAARAATTVPGYPDGLSGAIIVAHGAEPKYVRRAVSRITQALRQLPTTDECWVALYWTNGESVSAIADQIDWDSIPPHVAGIMFVGAVVAFPHRNIDVYVIALPRGFRSDGERSVQSTLDNALAEKILDRTEASSGVRASLLRGKTRGKRRQLLRRDGTERIPPFILLVDRDPRELSVPGATTRGTNSPSRAP